MKGNIPCKTSGAFQHFTKDVGTFNMIIIREVQMKTTTQGHHTLTRMIKTEAKSRPCRVLARVRSGSWNPRLLLLET